MTRRVVWLVLAAEAWRAVRPTASSCCHCGRVAAARQEEEEAAAAWRAVRPTASKCSHHGRVAATSRAAAAAAAAWQVPRPTALDALNGE